MIRGCFLLTLAHFFATSDLNDQMMLKYEYGVCMQCVCVNLFGNFNTASTALSTGLHSGFVEPCPSIAYFTRHVTIVSHTY